MKKELDKLVAKRAIRELSIEKLLVDESYQREVKKGHLKIIENFDENSLGTPVIGEREDGSLWIVDGLQRITALKKIGRTKVRCDVFNSRGPEHEAKVFDDINRFRTKLHPREVFRSRMTAGDSDAWAVYEAVKACGCTVRMGGKHNNASSEKEITCIGVLLRIYDSWGVDVIRTYIQMFQESGWVVDPAWTNSVLVYGFCSWLSQNEGERGIDRERMIRNMRTTSPGRLMYSSTLGAGNRQSNMVDLVAKLYRKKVSTKSSGDPRSS